MLGCGCIGFGVGVWVWVEEVLPWRECDVVRGVPRVFFLKVCLLYVDDLSRVYGDFVGSRVSDGVNVGLVFGVRL